MCDSFVCRPSGDRFFLFSPVFCGQYLLWVYWEFFELLVSFFLCANYYWVWGQNLSLKALDVWLWVWEALIRPFSFSLLISISSWLNSVDALLNSFVHPYVTICYRTLSYVIHMLPYVTHTLQYVTRTLPYVTLVLPYVTRILPYVTKVVLPYVNHTLSYVTRYELFLIFVKTWMCSMQFVCSGAGCGVDSVVYGNKKA